MGRMRYEGYEKSESGWTQRVGDVVGIWGAAIALYLGIPALALHLAWADGATPWMLVAAALLIGTACSAWRDMERGHVGRLSGSLTGASLVVLAYGIWPAL